MCYFSAQEEESQKKIVKIDDILTAKIINPGYGGAFKNQRWTVPENEEGIYSSDIKSVCCIPDQSTIMVPLSAALKQRFDTHDCAIKTTFHQELKLGDMPYVDVFLVTGQEPSPENILEMHEIGDGQVLRYLTAEQAADIPNYNSEWDEFIVDNNIKPIATETETIELRQSVYFGTVASFARRR